MSFFTELTPKHLMNFFGYDNYETARKTAVKIKRKCNTEILTITHLADYLSQPVEKVAASIK